MMWELLSHLSAFVLIVHMEILDLIAPEGQSTGTDVQHYVWSQTCQHHRFILLRGRQLHPHNVQLSRQCRRACRADDWRTAELLRSVLITENMWARCDPSEGAQLSATLWEITQEGVIADGHAFVKDSKKSFREKNYKAKTWCPKTNNQISITQGPMRCRSNLVFVWTILITIRHYFRGLHFTLIWNLCIKNKVDNSFY